MSEANQRGDEMFTYEQLHQMQSVDINTVDINSLVDLSTILVDTSTSYVDRACWYLQQIKNPYVFRVGNVAVKIEHTKEGRPLQEAISSYLTLIRK